MSIQNPTALRLGMSGALNGWRGRVAGRVVVGMEEDGETYYWNEFNLVDGFGRSATLVYEETEDGPEWKFFKTFEPLRAMSAEEAATKRVGETVHLDGIARRITLVDESRVYHIEGTAPEGVEVGDIARYFNVDTGDRMLVVSWTGDEVEFFEGVDVTAAAVATAFSLPAVAPRLSSPHGFGGDANAHTRSAVRWISGAAVVVFGLLAVVVFSGRRTSRSTSPTPRSVVQAAPTLRLSTGAQGALAQHTYTVEGHTVVSLGRTAGRFQRYEYALRDETGRDALLVNGLHGGPREWHLLQAVAAPTSLTPYAAAALRTRAAVSVEGHTLAVTDIFQSQLRFVQGVVAAIPGTAGIAYGFVAHARGEWLVARWSESAIQLHVGTELAEAAVRAALAAPNVEAPRANK